MALRRTTSPQTFRLYNTFTDASNYERGFMRWTSNVLQIGTEKAGTGTARSFAITLDGTTLISINNSTTAGCGIQSNVSLAGGFGIGFRSGNFSTATTTLHSDANDTLDLRRAANPQTFRIYNTYTSATNFERLNLRWASNELIIDAEAGSAGGTLRGIKLGSASTDLLGFFGATPVDQPALTADLLDSIQALGLVASGSGDTPLNLSGGTLTAGNLVLTDNTGAETATFDAQSKLTANRTVSLTDRSGAMVLSDTTVATGADAVTNIVSLTQAEYNAIGSPDAATLYLITDP